MVIEFDMNEPDYLSSLCLGFPFDYIDTIEFDQRLYLADDEVEELSY